MASQALTCNGHPVDAQASYFGELQASNDLLRDPIALKRRAEENGYLFIRRLIPPSTVLEARREILLKYATVGEIDNTRHDVMDGVLRAPATSPRSTWMPSSPRCAPARAMNAWYSTPTCWRCMPT